MIVLEKILMLFYPKRCLLCGRAGAVNGDELCADCAKLQPDIRVRFFALHAGRRDYTLECRAPQRYKEPFRSSLWRFKFKNETKLAKPLAKLMLPAIDKNRVWDCIVPVPISRERLKQRGYDQSVLLAKEVSKLTGIPCRTDILEKKKHNRTQHNLSAKEREANVGRTAQRVRRGCAFCFWTIS
jgi:competence protein ComFC